MKECFGELGNTTVKWIQRSGVHFVATDEEKMKECHECELFSQCAWEMTLAILKETLKLVDEQRPKGRRRPLT
jgi:hypothetical protein